MHIEERAVAIAFFRLEKNKPSVLPEPIEAVGAQLGILDRMHDVAVA